MDIFLKVARKEYEVLRSQIPPESPAREAIDKATPISHSLEGVLFEGYNIPCNEIQARIILKIAQQHCPEVIPEMDKAIRAAKGNA
jgi:hypothetical protein